MSRRFILAAALACCAACDGSGGSNAGADAANAPVILPGATDPAATVNLRSSDGAGCTTSWNGETVTPEGLQQRSRQIMDTAVSVAGGLDNMTAERIPYLKVEVGREVALSCLAPVLETIRNVGYSRVGLKPDETGPPAEFAYFPLTQVGAQMPRFAVAIAADGRMTWSDEPVDAAALGQRVTAFRTGPDAPESARGEIVIVPSPDARFSALYEAISIIRRAGMEPDLSLSAPPAG
jgi:biopolymer transport protein ExbD